jgi:hypothetical protein
MDAVVGETMVRVGNTMVFDTQGGLVLSEASLVVLEADFAFAHTSVDVAQGIKNLASSKDDV